jgi:hypothetical protein|tara:strand:- start:20 stop:391 length:372 start_codon:yes stop_codon:yes gene_type:complete
MKSEHIPFLSYIFIGITSLVLTYATITDKTTKELDTPSSPGVEESSVDKIKSLLLPVSDESQSSTTDNERDDVTPQNTIPVAKPVNDDNKQLYGGKTKQKKTRRKGKNTKTNTKTRNQNKKLK